MKFLFLGAGAIGTYVGGSLAAAGDEVTFIERPETAAVIAEPSASGASPAIFSSVVPRRGVSSTAKSPKFSPRPTSMPSTWARFWPGPSTAAISSNG